MDSYFKNIFERIILLFKPYVKKIVIIFICILFSSAIAMALPFISKEIMDRGLLDNNLNLVVMFSFISFMLVLADQGIGMIETYYRALISSMLSFTLSKKAFKHVLRLKIQYFSNINITEIMNNVGIDIKNICRLTDRGSFYIITSLFKIFGGMAGLLLIDWKLTLLVVFLMPVRLILVRYLARLRKSISEKYLEIGKEYASWYGDTVEGVKEIRLWGVERIKTGEFIRKQRPVVKTEIKLEMTDRLNEFSESVLFGIVTNVLYIIGAYMVFKGVFTVGGLFAFLTYSVYVTAPVSAIFNIGYSLSGILPSAKRFFEFLDRECEKPYTNGLKSRHIDRNSVQGDIVFEGVSFGYEAGEPVLSNISLKINSGEKVALAGENGSGKSTLIDLLLRLHDPDVGKILLDGMDIGEFCLKDFRQLISVISQDIYLFNRSVRENITMGLKLDKHELDEVLSKSTADKFIGGLQQEMETKVGKNGASLSGGEKQKIAVARALARNSRILILDEATSNFDRHSEETLNELVIKGLKDRTILLVSHRTEILRQMDKIVLLKDGKILDIGTFEELYRRCEYFRKIILKETITGSIQQAV